jgi:quinohemoprotein ethanol dehydrogenase
MKAFYHLGVALATLGLIVATPAFGDAKAKPGAARVAWVTGERIAANEAQNWLSHGRGYDEKRYSPLRQINADNISQLRLAWFQDLPTKRGQEATPIVVDGMMFTTSAWSHVQAFDAATGRPLWTFDPKVPGAYGIKACCDVVNRGVAVWKGRVFVGTIDGRLIALDAKTGKLLWSRITVDQGKPYTITGAPRVIKGKVLIGNGGAEMGVRGYISAYDADKGTLAWRFYTVPNPQGKPDGAVSDRIMADKVAPTWFDGEWKTSGGGGTIWDSMAYDPELDLLYLGVGNSSPWNYMVRSGGKGDNLFVSSILALRPDTGDYVWHYQTTPRR